MQKQFVFASFLLVSLLILGCTQPGTLGGQEAIDLAKAFPQISSFLSEHPGASATAVYLSADSVSKQLTEIQSACGSQMEAKPYYKIVFDDASTSSTAYVDATSRLVECAIVKSKATPIPTLKASATPTNTPSNSSKDSNYSSSSLAQLVVEWKGTGGGKVINYPNEINEFCQENVCYLFFEKGATVTVSAEADSGSKFFWWEGDCDSFKDSCTLLLDDDKNVSVDFELEDDSTPTPSTTITPTASIAATSTPEPTLAATSTPVPTIVSSNSVFSDDFSNGFPANNWVYTKSGSGSTNLPEVDSTAGNSAPSLRIPFPGIIGGHGTTEITSATNPFNSEGGLSFSVDIKQPQTEPGSWIRGFSFKIKNQNNAGAYARADIDPSASQIYYHIYKEQYKGNYVTQQYMPDANFHNFKFTVDDEGNAKWYRDGILQESYSGFPVGDYLITLSASGYPGMSSTSTQSYSHHVDNVRVEKLG